MVRTQRLEQGGEEAVRRVARRQVHIISTSSSSGGNHIKHSPSEIHNSSGPQLIQWGESMVRADDGEEPLVDPSKNR